PGLFGLGLGELTGLKVVPTELAVTTPHVPVDVLASLVQGGVPHRPTDIAELLALAGLLLGQSRPVATTRQHETPPSSAVLLVLHIALDGRRRRTPDGGHEVTVGPQRRKPGLQVRELLPQHPGGTPLDRLDQPV